MITSKNVPGWRAQKRDYEDQPRIALFASLFGPIGRSIRFRTHQMKQQSADGCSVRILRKKFLK
jgi:hypothetical protein